VRLCVWLPGGLVAASALALAAGPAGDDRNEAAALVSATGGTAVVTDSRGGGAIVRADNLAPGGSARGTVTIANSGDATGAFTLAQAGLTDVAGAGGGRLSSRLELTVEEIGSARRVYAGGLAGMEERALGYWEPGESRTYEFTVAFPDASDDNSFAGARTTVAFDWSAATGGPPDDPATAEPPRPVAPAPADTRAPRVRVRAVPHRWTPRTVPITITCDERCFLIGMSRGARPKPRERLLAGVPTEQTVRVSRADAKVLYERVQRRGHATLALALTVRDRAGNRATAGFAIRVHR
jgi:hypothetical protein